MINAHSLCHLEPLQNAALKFTKVQNAAVNYSSAGLVPLAGLGGRVLGCLSQAPQAPVF